MLQMLSLKKMQYYAEKKSNRVEVDTFDAIRFDFGAIRFASEGVAKSVIRIVQTPISLPIISSEKRFFLPVLFLILKFFLRNPYTRWAMICSRSPGSMSITGISIIV